MCTSGICICLLWVPTMLACKLALINKNMFLKNLEVRNVDACHVVA